MKKGTNYFQIKQVMNEELGHTVTSHNCILWFRAFSFKGLLIHLKKKILDPNLLKVYALD